MLWPLPEPLASSLMLRRPSQRMGQNVTSNLLLGSINKNCKNMQSIPFGHFFHASSLVKRQHFRKMRGFFCFVLFCNYYFIFPTMILPLKNIERIVISKKKMNFVQENKREYMWCCQNNNNNIYVFPLIRRWEWVSASPEVGIHLETSLPTFFMVWLKPYQTPAYICKRRCLWETTELEGMEDHG